MFKLRTYHAPDFSQEPFCSAPDVHLEPVTIAGAAPDDFHSMSIYPEYFKVGGEWLLAEESRMDCTPVYQNGRIAVVEPRNLKPGDLVITGRTEDASQGIYLWSHGFEETDEKTDTFAFRLKRSRETSFTQDYEDIADLLRHEKEHGKIVWVMGPAFSFDAGARDAFARLVDAGYVQAMLAGNALATHDLEGAYLHTALGQDIVTRQNMPNGHYNHLETINKCRQAGSIAAFIEKEHLDNGIMCALERNHIPYVLAGSIRDDGPLPPVIGNVYEAQDAMRNQLRDATTVITMATMLHSIATGNMTPSYRVMPDGTIREVYFYIVDISEFTVNKLADRGSLSSQGIVTNVQDFITHLARQLNLL